MEKQILSIVMQNEESAIARLTDIFSAKGYSIENINAGTINYDNNTSSITITLYETKERIDRLLLQLKRVIPVVDIKNISHHNVEKELVLINMKIAPKEIFDKYKVKNIAENVYELLDIPDKVDNLVKELNKIGCYNIVRSGVLAIGC
ncbi:MAG: acetolactate synthase small subunit [Rickettsiales bacterium]|jgi:acetolactate synthase-1/3 small subunit|nr:acetolactate synthase small subunit [Rickettsiales bacterium]